MKLRKSDKWILALLFLGFAGAADFYLPYIGVNARFGLACPVCAYILAPGLDPHSLFIRYTLVLGALNAVFWLIFGGLVWALVSVVKRLRKGRKEVG